MGKSGEEKVKPTKWGEAISHAKDLIRSLGKSIRAFNERKKAGEPWPESATHN
jgi:hypothetical protein